MKTPTIVFTMLNELGHVNPTFKLAKGLKARGYDVRYLTIAELQPCIEAEGFGVEPLFPDLYPPGALEAQRTQSLLVRRRAITARYRVLLERLLTTSPFGAADPALLLVDVTQTHFALWARRAGVAFFYVNTSLPQTWDPGVPPLRSGSPHGAHALGKVRSALEWQRFLIRRRTSGRLASFGGMSPPYELARHAAERFGVAAHDLDSRTMYMPQLRSAPELVLCPESFDFPRAPRPGRVYVESIDLERKEPDFPWSSLTPDKPLVYCALGGQRYRASEVPALFRRLVELFRARPGWQLCLAVGPHMPATDLAIPANVVVVERAPQQALLQRARVMITHGGLGSVKECIMYGVPMLCVPLDIDQPGNVARVTWHGVGLAVHLLRSPIEVLDAALDRLLNDPAFAVRARDLQARFRETEAAGRGATLVAAHFLGSPTR